MTSGAMAKNGELYVLDMGKPVKIYDLAEEMIRLSGLEPYKDIDILSKITIFRCPQNQIFFITLKMMISEISRFPLQKTVIFIWSKMKKKPVLTDL